MPCHQSESVISGPDLNTLSTLELFRLEAEDKLRELAVSLHQLAHGARAPKPLAVCLYAANSLKDAAHMAELPTVVSLAQGLESCLNVARRGRHGPRLSTIDLFQRCVDLLGRMARATHADSAPGSGMHAETQKLLASLRQREQAALALTLPAAGSPDLPAVPAAAPVAAAPPSAVSATLPPATPPPATLPPATLPPLPPLPPLAPAAAAGYDDVPLLELFRQEAEELAKTLLAGLRVLRYDPYAARQIESCMRAAHSFKGAARISGVSAAVDLSRALEESFAAAQDRSISLNRESIEFLVTAVELLMRVARAAGRAAAAGSSWKRADVDAFLAALKRLSRGVAPLDLPELPPAGA